MRLCHSLQVLKCLHHPDKHVHREAFRFARALSQQVRDRTDARCILAQPGGAFACLGLCSNMRSSSQTAPRFRVP